MQGRDCKFGLCYLRVERNLDEFCDDIGETQEITDPKSRKRRQVNRLALLRWYLAGRIVHFILKKRALPA